MKAQISNTCVVSVSQAEIEAYVIGIAVKHLRNNGINAAASDISVIGAGGVTATYSSSKGDLYEH